MTRQQAASDCKNALLTNGHVPGREGDGKQMKAGAGDGAPPGDHSTLARGARQAGEVSVSPVPAPVWLESWEMFPRGGSMASAGRRVPMLALAAQTLNALDCRSHSSCCGRPPAPPWKHLWSWTSLAPPTEGGTLTFTEVE